MDFDLDQLVEAITKEIIRRMADARPKSILTLEGCPSGIVSGDYEVKNDPNSEYGYVLMTADAYHALVCCKPAAACDMAASCPQECDCCSDDETAVKGAVIDLSCKRLLHERDLRDNNAQRGDVIKVSKRTIITALAHDYAKSIGVKIIPG